MTVQAWNGHSYASRPIKTADFDYASDQFELKDLYPIPGDAVYLAKSVLMNLRTGERVIVTDRLDDLFAQLVPRFEREPKLSTDEIYRMLQL